MVAPKYFSFWNSLRKISERPGLWRPRHGCVAPGYIGDEKNYLPGGFNRLARYQKLPVRASKLYWRQEKIKGRGI